MNCREFDDVVEAIVAGDVPESEDVRSHRASCARCATVYATAVRIEQALAVRPVEVPSPRFNAAVMMRIRSERWRADERVDRVFNAAVIASVLAIVAGGLALLNLGSVTTAIVAVADVTAAALSRRPAAPSETIPFWSYVAGFALLAMSVLVWRWAETPRQATDRVTP